jgi:hypothetical protein
MRYVLPLWVLLIAAGGSTASAQQGQQQVQPVPASPTPLLLGPNSTACLVGCDTQVMNCQNSCVVVGPTTTANPAGNAPCVLNCSNQSLVCKQACNRPQQ